MWFSKCALPATCPNLTRIVSILSDGSQGMTKLLLGLFILAMAFAPGSANAAPVPEASQPELGGGPNGIPLIRPGDAADGARLHDDPATVPAAEPPIVHYDPDELPPPVRRLREQILEAAASGDPKNLAPIFEANGEPPLLSFDDQGDDPIDFLRSISSDPEGREILAILIEVLEAGYVHIEPGTEHEMYVWPYFAHYPVDALTPAQIVELLKLVYVGDYEDMQTYGTYLFYRVGLAPDGTWRYFVAGD